MALALAITLALMAAIRSEEVGFTLKVDVIDVMMINRALMLLPDDHARQTLAKVRRQLVEQVK
jgi:hypothetical protein